MEADKDTIDRMIERERYRKIAEKYRRPRNDRYRKNARRARNVQGNIQTDDGIRIPLRFIAGVMIFVAAVFYIGSDDEGAIAVKEKIKNVLAENIDFEEFKETGKSIINIGNESEVKVDEKVIEDIEEKDYIPQYP